MMYQTAPQYQPELNHMQQYTQAPNIIQPAIPPTVQQVSPYVQQLSQHASPISSFPVDRHSLSGTQLPMPSPMSLNEYRSYSGTPLSHSPLLPSVNSNQQAAVPPLTLDDDMVYNCNFLGQLQGNYEVETSDGQDQVSVIVPTLADVEKQYAIVRRVCSDGEALPDQFIYQEPTQFTLCSVSPMGESVLAVFRRGSSMKHTVKWENIVDRSQIVWRRKGVTFNLVSADSLAPSRRNSISSVGTAFSSCINSPLIAPNGMPMNIRPELLHQNVAQQNRPMLAHGYSSDSHVSNVSSVPSMDNLNRSNGESDPREEAMFELIKAHCVGNSSLLKRMVHWAMRNRSMRRVSPEDVSSMSEGRLWVTAHPVGYEDDAELPERLQESLEDIKGAYREVRTGVYKQPEPQLNEPGIQHRVMKGRGGRWKIEGHEVDTGRWYLCADEQPDGSWVDYKNNKEVIRVQLIPMKEILEKLGEEYASENQELEKSIEFLFTNCNQKKLNSKLKGRNLKHNISNLKVKLEKQYALRFAVTVATTADAIAQNIDLVS